MVYLGRTALQGPPDHQEKTEYLDSLDHGDFPLRVTVAKMVRFGHDCHETCSLFTYSASVNVCNENANAMKI